MLHLKTRENWPFAVLTVQHTIDQNPKKILCRHQASGRAAFKNN
jgi:hypothetical protein